LPWLILTKRASGTDLIEDFDGKCRLVSHLGRTRTPGARGRFETDEGDHYVFLLFVCLSLPYKLQLGVVPARNQLIVVNACH
jgi:hypothetical protein